MASPTLSATASCSLRIVQAIAGKSLVVALPLPPGLSVSQTPSSSNSLTAAAAMPAHDRAFWLRFSKSPVLLKISTILRGLGLHQLNSGPGKILFRHSKVDRLSDAVAVATERLPTDFVGLIEAAVDYNHAPLQEAVAQLLHRFGQDIWGTDSERTWLLKASEGHPEYTKDLKFDDASDKVVLKYYLRLWILVKTFNRVRNKARPRAIMLSETNTTRQMQNVSLSSQRSHNQAATPLQELTKPKGKRRIEKRYVSKAFVRNSSDESEEKDDHLATSSLEQRESPDSRSHRPGSSAEEHIYAGGVYSSHGFTPGSLLPESEKDQDRRRKLTRQRPGACKSCQGRHQKCDRIRPICGRCAELDFVCEFPNDADSRATSVPALTMPPTQPQSKSTMATQIFEIDSTATSTKSPATSHLKLDKYWDNNDWRLYFTEGDECKIMLATVRSLGLKATTLPDPMQLDLEIDHFRSLSKDINTVARSLSSKHSGSQLFQCAQDRTYLDEEIDNLLETHSSVWSLDADRTNHLAPGEDENYPTHLYYEESEDQKLLWMHLHRWIFIMAFWNRRQISGPAENNSESMTEVATESEDMSIQPQLGSVDTIKAQQYGHEKSIMPLATKLGVVSRTSSTRNQKRKDSGTAAPERLAILRSPKQRRISQRRATAQGYDFCMLLLSYLENYTDPSFDELAALANLSRELSSLKQHAADLQSANVYELEEPFLNIAFPAWLQYRTDVVTVKREQATMQSSTGAPLQHRHLVVLERSRLAMQLRQAREKFVQAGHGGLRPEQIIIQATEMLTSGRGQALMAESLRNGFRDMEQESIELGDRLMKGGGAKFVMGDFPLATSLRGFESQ